jgi:hypothetical protein
MTLCVAYQQVLIAVRVQYKARFPNSRFEETTYLREVLLGTHASCTINA